MHDSESKTIFIERFYATLRLSVKRGPILVFVFNNMIQILFSFSFQVLIAHSRSYVSSEHEPKRMVAFVKLFIHNIVCFIPLNPGFNC